MYEGFFRVHGGLLDFRFFLLFYLQAQFWAQFKGNFAAGGSLLDEFIAASALIVDLGDGDIYLISPYLMFKGYFRMRISKIKSLK